MDNAWYCIETRYIGPSNLRGSRVRAFIRDGSKRSVLLSYDPAFDSLPNHRAAAMALVRKLQLDKGARWIAGAHPRGYVFVAEQK